MNKFEKVSYEQFEKDYMKCFSIDTFTEEDKEWLQSIYNNIKLPSRAHKGDAGADFFSPISFRLDPGTTIKIPTGIRCYLDEDKFLALFSRSSLGFRYRLWLDNLTGIVDYGYVYSDNEGHIMAKLTNNSLDGKQVTIKEGMAFMQGIILPYFVAENDSNSEVKRNGGEGSSNR